MRRPLLLFMVAAVAGCIVHVDHDLGRVNFDPDHVEYRSLRADGPITDVVANVDVGTLSLEGSTRSDATVDLDLAYDWGSEPDVDVYTSGTTLVISVDCPSHGDCAADVVAQIPYDAVLDTTVGVGDVAVSDVVGDWVGTVHIGNLRGSRLASLWVDALVDTGNLDLGFHLEPDTVLAEVGIGNLHVQVPAATYAVTTAVSTGSVWLDGIVTNPLALREIEATVTTGNIEIQGF